MTAPEHSLPALLEAVAQAIPERPALVWRGRVRTWDEVTDRTRRVAGLLRAHGIGPSGPRDPARPWHSPHDHVALYLLNGPEYLEVMLGAAKARAASFNVNHRYVADELTALLLDARPAAVAFHGRFAETLAEVLPRLEVAPRLLLQVADEADAPLLPGALDLEAALAASEPLAPDPAWSPDDLYILFTGGTTGSPKGVLWRQGDFLATCLGIDRSTEELVEAARRADLRTLPAPPFMHGAAQWNALSAWLAGGTVVVQDVVDRFDPVDLLDTCARERVTSLLIVGDAFARPLVDALRAAPRELPDLRFILTGGAILSPAVKAELLALLPAVRVVDVLGSSETGRHGVHTTTTDRPATDPSFVPSATTVVLDEARTGPLAPGSAELGWLAQQGRVPLGYLHDPAKTRATFPVIGGVRHAVAGDRARIRADGSLDLHGRDSVTINTGGEKVFAEEVEAVLKSHPSVFDALVVGQPDPRFGQVVAAVVSLRPGARPDDDGLRATCREHLAPYKVPRTFVYRPQVSRSPSGKPDYVWARDQLPSPT